MVALDATVVSIALPHAQASLHFSSADRQWIVTAYALTFGSLLLLGGRLADIFGRKRLFLIGVTGFAAASAVGGASQSFAMLVTAHAAQGAFGAVLAPAALSLLTTTFSHPDERRKAFGVYGGIATAGASVGLLIGGALTQYLNWRWTMFINVAIACIVIAGAAVFLSSHVTEARQRVDRAGAVLGGLGLFAVVYGFAHAAAKSASAGWTDPQTIGSITVGIVLLVAFVIAERRVAYPLLPLRVVLDRNRGGSYSAMLLTSIGLFSVFLFLTYYLDDDPGLQPGQDRAGVPAAHRDGAVQRRRVQHSSAAPREPAAARPSRTAARRGRNGADDKDRPALLLRLRGAAVTTADRAGPGYGLRTLLQPRHLRCHR